LSGKYAVVGMDGAGRVLARLFRGSHLLAWVDPHGGDAKSFVEPPYPKDPKSILNSFIAKSSPDGSVWVGFEAIGVLRQYSRSGELIREIDVVEHGNNYSKQMLEGNFANARKGLMKFRPIIRDLACLGDEIIVTRGGMVCWLMRFDSGGKLRTVFSIAPKFEWYGTCQHVDRDDAGRLVFYMNQHEDDESSIGLYKAEDRRP